MANEKSTSFRVQNQNKEAWDRITDICNEQGVGVNTLLNLLLPSLADVLASHKWEEQGYAVDFNLGTISIK